MKMYCYWCNKTITPVAKKERTEQVYRHQKFYLTETKYYCPHCNNELIDEVLDEGLTKYYNGYLALYDLELQSFLEIRLDLGLSQELFAKALGWSKKSIIRFEKREEIPSNEYLKVYKKLHDNKDTILENLEFNKLNIDRKDYLEILKRLNLNINYKTRNVIKYLLADNKLFIINLLKMLFACDFLSYKELGTPLTNFKYARLPFGPVIDNYVMVINELIKSNEIALTEGLIVKDELKPRYKRNKEIDLSLFNPEEIEIMDAVKEKLTFMSAKEISDWSHKFLGWQNTPNGHIIDYQKYAQYFVL